MNDTLLSGRPVKPAAPSQAATKVPPKFLDPETGEIRVDQLVRSYLELERRLSQSIDPPASPEAATIDPRLRRLLGVPDKPEDYCIDCGDSLVEPDEEVNRRLHAAGLTQPQAQLVYDLAGEKLMPALYRMADDLQAERELESLTERFGGEAKWREIAQSLTAWGRRNLSPQVYEALSGTRDGVLAMYQMMTSGEPTLLEGGGAETGGESDLRRLMADPRYWRDGDPSVVGKVSEGYKRLYGRTG